MNRTSLRKIRGQGMSEYIIITALIAVSAIGIFAAFGDVLQDQTAGMAQEMSGQSGAERITSAQQAADAASDRADTASGLGDYDAANQDVTN